MGERLNIEIVKEENGETVVLANSYFQWSGYTTASVELVRKINKVLSIIPSEDLKTFTKDDACGLLSLTGAGMESAIIASIPKATDRNVGLIGYTDAEIDENRDWANETVVINLSTETIDYTRGVFKYEECTVEEIRNLVHLPFAINAMSFSDFTKFDEVLFSNSAFTDNRGIAYGCIE